MSFGPSACFFYTVTVSYRNLGWFVNHYKRLFRIKKNISRLPPSSLAKGLRPPLLLYKRGEKWTVNPCLAMMGYPLTFFLLWYLKLFFSKFIYNDQSYSQLKKEIALFRIDHCMVCWCLFCFFKILSWKITKAPFSS